MLKKPKPSQKGLKKLPTAIRNKMGYMKDGGGTKQNPSDPRRVDKEKLMEKGPSKFTAGRPKSRMPMQTGPRRISERGPRQSLFQQLKQREMMRKRQGK